MTTTMMVLFLALLGLEYTQAYTAIPYFLKPSRKIAIQAQKTDEIGVHPWYELSTQLLNDGLITNKSLGLRERPG